MGPDKKDTAPLTVYMDGQPVGTAYGEIPEISLAAEEPTEAEQAGKALARVWAACREALEFQEAMRWASVYNRPLAYRYRHTKKKRTRKKYAKRILAWYREEVL